MLDAFGRAGTKPKEDEVDDDPTSAGMTFANPLRQNDPGKLTITTAQR
jgi:hypothetical protein